MVFETTQMVALREQTVSREEIPGVTVPWELVTKLKGRRLATIAQERVFQITEVWDDRVTVKVSSTGKVRSIARDEFEAVWREMGKQFKISWNEVRDKYSSVNPSYVMAILARLPGVRVSTSPLEIGLRYR